MDLIMQEPCDLPPGPTPRYDITCEPYKPQTGTESTTPDVCEALKASTRKRSEFIDWESVDNRMKIKDDIHIWPQRPSVNREMGKYLPHHRETCFMKETIMRQN